MEYDDHRKLTVFFEIGSRPLFTLSGRQIISDVLDLYGGTCLQGCLALPPTVWARRVVHADPDVIIISKPRGAAITDAMCWRCPQVLREGHLYIVRPGLITPSDPRILEGANAACAALQAARSGSQR